MKKKIIISLLLVIAIIIISVICSLHVTAYNNTSKTNTVFVIDENGKATVGVSYTGYKNITTHAEINVKIHKEGASIPVMDETVEASGVGYDGELVCQLTENGKYICTVVYTVHGSGGEPDVIRYEKTLEYTKVMPYINYGKITIYNGMMRDGVKEFFCVTNEEEYNKMLEEFIFTERYVYIELICEKHIDSIMDVLPGLNKIPTKTNKSISYGMYKIVSENAVTVYLGSDTFDIEGYFEETVSQWIESELVESVIISPQATYVYPPDKSAEITYEKHDSYNYYYGVIGEKNGYFLDTNIYFIDEDGEYSFVEYEGYYHIAKSVSDINDDVKFFLRGYVNEEKLAEFDEEFFKEKAVIFYNMSAASTDMPYYIRVGEVKKGESVEIIMSKRRRYIHTADLNPQTVVIIVDKDLVEGGEKINVKYECIK